MTKAQYLIFEVYRITGKHNLLSLDQLFKVIDRVNKKNPLNSKLIIVWQKIIANIILERPMMNTD
jgi:hypothetical protein